MTIKYTCGECGSSLKIKDKLAGTAGKCPKCKTEFTVPQPGEGDEEPAKKTSKAGKKKDGESKPKQPAEINEEDAIFGEGFFELQHPTSTRPKYTMPDFDDDDDDDSFDDSDDDLPASSPKPFTAASAGSDRDNAADIAGNLLGKTGKKNTKIEKDYDPNDGQPEYDFSAIKYLVTHRILPAIAAFIVVAGFFYWTIGSMFYDERELPDLATVTGTVYLDDKPVAAEITFNPLLTPAEQKDESSQTRGANSKAWSNPDGTFEVMYTHDIYGAIPGKHIVEIRIGTQRFEQNVEVKEGSNENFDFKLKTPPKQEVDPNSL